MEHGYTGLKNLGNTCYMNSILQCLFHTEYLNEIFDKPIEVHKVPYSVLTLEYKELYDIAMNNNCIIKPSKFWVNMQKVAKYYNYEQFVGPVQNDACEFLTFIMDSFHESTKYGINIKINGRIKNRIDEIAHTCYKRLYSMYKDGYSDIIDKVLNYQITLITDLKKQPKILSINCDPIHILHLPLPDPNFIYKNHLKHHIDDKKITIYDCLDYYIHPECLEHENQWYNEETNEKQDVIKKTMFYKFSDYVFICLKRFNMMMKKNATYVEFPIEGLDLTSYVCSYKNKPSYIYDLYAVCNHMGTIHYGHYTAFIKKNEGWYLYNDDKISKIPSKRIISSYAYCLFYKRRYE